MKAVAAASAAALLSGCNAVLLDPAGDVAAQQRDLLVASVALMLLIIVPVMVLIVLFAWRYRESNEEATYAPDWDHSTMLELVIWSAPLLIIICLGAMTWLGTHTLDPYRPLDRIDAARKTDPAVKPLEIDVVAMDWKWLFIYPEQGIATVNQIAVPVDRPVKFNITSTSMMNSFFVPAMAGQIYAMPGMQTVLQAVLNEPGRYRGFSANYSGAGFSEMNFWTLGLDQAGFDQWVAKVKASRLTLDDATYLRLEKPSENVPAIAFNSVSPTLYHRILNRCVHPGDHCIDQMMMRDMHRGSETPVNEGVPNRKPEGAIFDEPDREGGKHQEAPLAPPSGNRQPGNEQNRSLTLTTPATPHSMTRAIALG